MPFIPRKDQLLTSSGDDLTASGRWRAVRADGRLFSKKHTTRAMVNRFSNHWMSDGLVGAPPFPQRTRILSAADAYVGGGVKEMPREPFVVSCSNVH